VKTIMKRLLITIGLGLAIVPNAAGADEPPAQASCELGSQPLIGGDPNRVTIGCNGVNDAFADQLIELTNRMLRDRINPQTVLAKLDEVERVPDDGVARTLNDLQRQAIIQTLHGQDNAQIMITAHPSVDDSAGYAKDLATPLLMAGWQIEGHQVRRTAPKPLEPVQGVAIVVRDTNAPPKKALRLKAALTAAKVAAPFVSDPRFDAEATMLWIGKRPVFTQADAAK
jgi:hypothetical protein